MHVMVHESMEAINADGSFNYKLLNGYVYDDNGNNVGIFHMQVKSEVVANHVPSQGYYDVQMKENNALKKLLQPAVEK